MTSDSDHNSVMDVVDVEENVNEVSMDEVSVGCDPEYEDYGTVGTNDADKAENADYPSAAQTSVLASPSEPTRLTPHLVVIVWHAPFPLVSSALERTTADASTFFVFS
jgi:hypothetical protein